MSNQIGENIKFSKGKKQRKIDFSFLIILSFLPVFVSSSIVPGFADSSAYMILVLVVFILQGVIMFSSAKDVFGRVHKSTILVGLILILIQIFTLSTNIATNTSIDILDLINFFIRFMCIYIFFNLPQSISFDDMDVTKFLKRFLIFIIIACLYNIVINFGQFVKINQLAAYAVEFKSFYLNRNSFGQILYIGFSISLYFLLRKKNFLSFISFIIILTNLLLTFSRTSIGSGIIFFLFYFILTKRVKKRIKVIWIIVIALVMLFLITSDSSIKFIEDYFIRKDTGLTNRNEIWLNGINELGIIHLMFGVGFNTGLDLFNSKSLIINQFHSFYVETIINGGLVELSLYLFIFSKIIIQCIRNKHKNYELSMFFISLIISMLVYGVTESISFFTIGYVGTLFSTIFVVLPIVYFGFSNKKG